MSERWNEMDDMDLTHLESEMRGELEDLRAAATVYADRAWERSAGAAARPLSARPLAATGWMAWATAGVAATVLTVGGVRLVHHASAPVSQGAVSTPAVKVTAVSPVSDEALLEQIQSDISSGVPAAMEPLQASDARGARDVVKR